MVSKRLLDTLVCPETRQKVELAGAALLARINERIEQGDLQTRGGEVLTEPLEAGLVREDGAVLYPVRDGFPVMLTDEAIPLDPGLGQGEAEREPHD